MMNGVEKTLIIVQKKSLKCIAYGKFKLTVLQVKYRRHGNFQ